MKLDILLALLSNTILLLALSVIYQVTNILQCKYKNFRPVINGILISIICIVAMRIPFTFDSGIIFDTRSIIISVTALTFNPISTAIVIAVSGLYRLSIGGMGALVGVLSVFLSAFIGLAWKRWMQPKGKKWSWKNLYAMGVVVHITLLATMLLLPYPNNINVIREISIPLMLIYPFLTVLVSMLLMHQQEIKSMEKQLRESERSKSSLISNLPGLAYRSNIDKQRSMKFLSEECFNLTGYTSDNLLSNKDFSYDNLIASEYYSELLAQWNHCIVNKLQFKYEYEIITSNGDRKWVFEMGKGIYDEQNKIEAFEGIILDISDKKQNEINIKYIIEHDNWTGLYNRVYLDNLIRKDVNSINRVKNAFIGINLSDIQHLIPRYGFLYTQNLIKEVAIELNKYSTDNNILCQTYENRFLFYIRDYKNRVQLIEFSEDIAKTLESIFIMDKISGGIGIIEIENNIKDNLDLILKRLLITTERSMSLCEKDFKICFYDQTLEAIVNRESEIIEELSRISKSDSCDNLYVQYQPIMDLKTDSICGFEALARLRTDKLGLVPPLEFIPIAEMTKLINPIGEKIIIDAFKFINKLKSHGYDKISISINISAIQLLRPDFTERFFEIIKDMNVNPMNINIEITESIFTFDFKNINNTLAILKQAGIHISIDDFGTGYSSLARVRELNVNCIKIDKYFIDKFLDINSEKIIISDIISMSHKLGHYIIAEGVEYESQLEYLRKHNCDKIQGYLISKPLYEEMALEFLKSKESMKSDNAIKGNKKEYSYI